MNKKPTVWYVDDLPGNLDRFAVNHRDEFHIQTFHEPEKVLEALKTGKPDALLCDIFFYETVERAGAIEEKVQAKARELRDIGRAIGADSEAYQSGITLVEQVSQRFMGNPPFPVYAYTSKGPYLLEGSGFDRIARAGAKWLFKGKYNPATESMIIAKDIDESRIADSWQAWVCRSTWRFLFSAGLVGIILVEVVQYLYSLLMSHFAGVSTQ